MTAAATSVSGLQMGRVLALSFGVVGRRWLTLLALLAILSWTPTIGLQFLWPYLAKAGVHVPQSKSLAFAVSVLLALLGGLVAASVVSASLQRPEDRGSPLSALAAAARALPFLLPFLVLVNGASFSSYWLQGMSKSLDNIAAINGAVRLASLAVTVLLTAVWGVLTPVVVTERQGLFGAYRRAAVLLSGSRWKLIWLHLAILFLAAVPSVLLVMMMISRDPHDIPRTPANYQMTVVAVSLLSTPISAFWCVIQAVSYRELTRIRDGVATADVADIFA